MFEYAKILTGQDRTGQDRTGQDRTGQDRTGQDRTGQDRTGQDRTGQDRRNTMIKIAIVDDEEPILDMLVKKIQTEMELQGVNAEIYSYTSSMALLKDIESREILFEAYFLDLDMPEISGFNLSDKLRNSNDSAPIIYITNRDDLMQQAFQYKVLGFVRKAYLDNELKFAIRCVVKEINTRSSFIDIKTGDKNGIKIHRMLITNIMYIEKDGRFTSIYTNDGNKIPTRKNIKDFVKESGFSEFIQINASCIVNYAYIKEINNTKINVSDNIVLYSSRRKAKEVIDKFMQLSRRLMI